MILLDTSALAKLLVEERESAELRAELVNPNNADGTFAISTVAISELRRLAIRISADPARVEPIVRPFHVLRLTEGILQLAGRIPTQHLGTLDAIHIATALVAEARGLISYDMRQAEAARNEGLLVNSPAP